MQGTGDDPSDFTWVAVDNTSTKGNVNTSQDFTTSFVPDPNDGTTAPVLTVTTNPSDNAENVAASTSIVLDFGQNVTAVPDKLITITDDVGNNFQIGANSPLVSIDGSVVTIDPSGANFSNGREYSVTIESGAFKNTSGEDIDVILAADGTFNFTIAPDGVGVTPDTTAPTLTGTLTPADNSTGVAVGTNISFTLSEDAVAVAGKNIFIVDDEDEGEGGTVTTIDAADTTQVTINGGVVTINPTADLINGKEYTVEIESGAFTDAAENPFNGTLATDGTFNFITVAEDTTAPTLIGTPTPANNAENVPANTNISFTLSEDAVAVAGKSIRIGDIEIDAADTTQVTINGGVVTINPTADLINSIGYIVEIESGAFTDAAGNPFDGELATDGLFNFITVAEDTTAPTFTGATTPADNSTGVAVGTNISFTLSEDAVAVPGKNITISSDGEDDIVIAADSSQVTTNGGVVTINPTADLMNGKEYTVAIESGAFTDAAGNEFDGTLATDGTFNFTTIAAPDTTAPTFSGATTPADNAMDVAVGTNISFTLNEDATPVAGKNITITDEDGTVTTIAADSSQVTINGGVVTINPTADLINGKEYTVAIESGAFTDAAGNEFNGELATDGAFNFTTIAAPDTTAPTFSGTLTPADNSTGVAVGTNISFTLSEDAVAVAGKNITISSDGEDDIVIAADSSQVTINGGLVTINPTADLMNGKEYTVEIESGAFTDAAGNEFDGDLGDDDGFNFTTIAAPVTTPDDTDAPTFLGTLTPADNSTGVAVGTNISFTLNEDVKAVAGKFIIISEGEDSFRIAADDSSQVTIAGGVVTINPSFNLMNGKDYTVEIESGAFTDDAGNPFNGELVDGEDYNFTTVAAAVTPPPTPDPITPVSPGSTIGTVTEGNNVMEVIDLRRFAGETVTATYEISREANYDNNIYFYKVDSADGSIDGIATDEEGYLAKALGNIVNTGITADDDANDVAGSFTLQGGDILGIAFVADGTLLQATSNLDSVEGVYLSFMGANTDNGTFDHVKFENGMFKFEDLANGGDKDFNDIELKIDFA